MQSGSRLLIALVAAVSATACAVPIQAGADFDPAVSLGRPTTFSWDEPDGLPTGDARLDANPIFVQRVHDAIERELAARGIRLDPSGRGDLLVHHHTSAASHVEVYATDRAAGNVESDYGPGTRVIEYEEGTWLVDVADRATGRMLWRGWSRTDITGAIESSKCTDLVDESIRKMFTHFPIPRGVTAPVAQPAPAPTPPPVLMCPLPTDS